MKVLVSGSSGLIGSALIASLAAAGHTAIRLVRSGGAGVRWDIDAKTIDTESMEGIDGVVHLAGEPIANKRWSDDKKQRILKSRVDGTSLLSNAVASLKTPPAVLVSGSAIGFYGDRGETILDEEAAKGRGFLSDVTSAWEASTAPAEQAGIVVSHIRTGIVLSSKGGVLKKLLPLYKFGLGGRLGSGDQWMSWIHLDDHVRAIRSLLENPMQGPVNLTAPLPVRNREFNSTLGDAVNRPAVLPIPEFGPKLLLGAELAEELLFASANVQPGRLIDSGFVFEHHTLRSALLAEVAEPPAKRPRMLS